MRTPEQKIAQPRAGKQFEDELQLRYLSPGAFTVLPPDGNPTPHPPAAPLPYRLTPSSRRHKNQSFAVIGETDPSKSTSRSPSPTGRVSPFRGRGFNPAGSRYVSPNHSPPPPQDARLTPTNLSPKHGTSKIPQLKRKGSSSAFGEKVYHHNSSPSKRKLENKLSRSMTNLEGKNTANRVPPSPKKIINNKAPAFQRLSPIVGSSPEPSQSLSSPSRIPKSRSTPPSRRTSPTRNTSSLANRPPPSKSSSRAVSRSNSRSQSRNQSRSQSRSQSRNTSRETSPSKNSSPSRHRANYDHVQAKVNSLPKKPKVPPKPQVLSEQFQEPDPIKNTTSNSKLTRNDSVNKLRTNSKSNLLSNLNNSNKINNNSTSDISSSIINKGISKTTARTNNNNENSNTNISSSIINKGISKTTARTNNNDSSSTNNNNVSQSNNSSPKKFEKEISEQRRSRNSSPTKDVGTIQYTDEHLKNSNSSPKKKEPIKPDAGHTKMSAIPDASHNMKDTTIDTNPKPLKKSESSVKFADELLPSTTTVVSSTTTTVTQPLKIDTKMNVAKNAEKDKPMSPMVDGRVLSATSVSNAMNKMNDTVLDCQTVIRDHGFSKPSPAASTTVSVANEPYKLANPALDTKNATTALPKVEPRPRLNPSSNPDTDTSISDKVNNFTSQLTHTGIVNSKALEREVQRNMHKLISPERVVGNMGNMGNMGNSVQSINDRIKEARTLVASDVKPIRITVKEKPSNIEVQSGNIRPLVGVTNGLNERPGLPPAQDTPPNEPVKEAPPKNVCTRFFSNCKNKMLCQCCKKKTQTESQGKLVDQTGCFSCLRKKEAPVTINIENERDQKTKFWDKLNCCNKNKVRNCNCFPCGKKKDSWAERRDSILSDPSQQQQPASRCSKNCCKGILSAMCCCLPLCCKKKIEEDPVSRKASIISKKKSLTPTTAPPQEDTRPKIDMSLVEHSSHMKGAIPVLPICLAWFCLIINCIVPGTGTFFSGLFCLCIGKPRFSQKDGPKQRVGSFLINTIIGFGQFFTVLFCLVGWGWSIWWGVIMVKVAKKHKKLKHLEAIDEASSRPVPANNQNHQRRDLQGNA